MTSVSIPSNIALLIIQITMVMTLMMLGSSASIREIDAEYGVRGQPADGELMQNFYKRLALIDLQDVKRLQDTEDGYIGNGQLSDYGTNYPIDRTYGERLLRKDDDNDDNADERDDESARNEAFVSDKSSDIIRDPELTQHSSNFGILQMSEEHLKTEPASDSLKSMKSEESLPFYCHPPNPCPNGFTSKDGCQEFIEDTAEYQKEWIRQMQKKGICSCDEEHMFDCGSESGESELVGSKEELDQVFDKIIKEKDHLNNPFTQGGKKRQSLVAKKSPRIKRDTKYTNMNEEISKMVKRADDKNNNPYLQGEKLPTVAKKGI